MIRPELVEIARAEPPAGRVILPVTCMDSAFQGALRVLTLRDAAGGELIVHLDAARPEVAPGAALWATWEPEVARLFPPDGAKEEMVFPFPNYP